MIIDVLQDYRRVMADIGLTTELQEKVLGGTAARLLGVET